MAIIIDTMQWVEIIDAVTTNTGHAEKLVEYAALELLGRNYCENAGNHDPEEIENFLTSYIEDHWQGNYDGTPEELHEILTGNPPPRYFDAAQWQYDLECDGWNFGEISPEKFAAFRP